MANANPYKARLGKKRLAKAGTLDDVTRLLWRGLCEARGVLFRAEDDELKLRAIHAISQAAGQYTRLLEVGELESRVEALEAAALRSPRRVG